MGIYGRQGIYGDGDDNDDHDDDTHDTHEGVWEYMAGRGYMGIRGGRADECGRPAPNIKWPMRSPYRFYKVVHEVPFKI